MDSLVMTPGTGERLLKFVGDRVSFSLHSTHGFPPGWKCFLRTNLGRAEILRRQIIKRQTGPWPLAHASWRDLPMVQSDTGWHLELSLIQVGYFKAKAYAVDPQGRQHWPAGADFGITVHPDSYRTANTIYCAFPRMFGESRSLAKAEDPFLESVFQTFDRSGYTIIPPSGKFRDVIKQLPHIFDTLGCRILHLLPINPTPTTMARFGRFGSPYAAQNLTAVDPALVDFDKKSTGIDQFCELAYATHERGGRVFLDIVANHTGWGAIEFENHPEWYLRKTTGEFVSPGAWGVTWEDLVEFDHRNAEIWEYLADVFLTWCRRGVDGFRCDAGYKIPVSAWEYITAKVRDEFPNTIFLLEGLGGSWEATENLLTEGGMQWAYSELFQNYSGREVAGYLDYALRQSDRLGLYVHYSETHDNDRLAKRGRQWSLLRNQLCALTSVAGGYGFTCGVEWLASEKINVHSSRGMAWGSQENIIPELAHLNRLLANHPCFFDGARITRLSATDAPVLALTRVSAEGVDKVLVLVNTDEEKSQPYTLPRGMFEEFGQPGCELLSAQTISPRYTSASDVEFQIPAGASFCLASTLQPKGLAGDNYRSARAQAAWALAAISELIPDHQLGPYDWQALAQLAARDPEAFLAAIQYLEADLASKDLISALHKAWPQGNYRPVVIWTRQNASRITPIPPHHWLLLHDEHRFQATLSVGGRLIHRESIPTALGQTISFPPGVEGDASLRLIRFDAEESEVHATLRYLTATPKGMPNVAVDKRSGLVLLTNGIGGMARIHLDPNQVASKYDAMLAANLHPTVPVDRHIFVKRIRIWVVGDGFISPLDANSLREFIPGPPARWRFIAGAGDGRGIELQMTADMLAGQNTTVIKFFRPAAPPAEGKDLDDSARVSLIVRVDIADRNFHWETQRNPDSERHFQGNAHPLPEKNGFAFTPAVDRHLRVQTDGGQYHHEPEWNTAVPHPVEASRGLAAQEDVWSPGWFELPLGKGEVINLVLTAEKAPISPELIRNFEIQRVSANEQMVAKAHLAADDFFGRQLAVALQAYVVRRNGNKTVIAGYPWFLDWGRDTLICARGLLAAGLVEDVRQLLITFGRFEENGTLPNAIHGEDASNRDTSDAALWYGVVCEDMAAQCGSPAAVDQFYSTVVDAQNRTLRDILRSIAVGYIRGTPNGIRMDAGSGLIWSPSHFTWMDTNFPASTPREGYPIEIQVLWVRLLRQLARLDARQHQEPWGGLAQRAEESLGKYFWLESLGYYSDLLYARAGQPAAEALPDNALRSNFLFGISLGLFSGERAQSAVSAAIKHLIVPGALRTLAPLPVSPALPIYAADGRLLNHPDNPYWGRYEGDEDTRRKPAYHNGTAWTWTFPVFCEALAKAWDFQPHAVTAARAYLGSMDRLLHEGCIGQIPEILDGDAPHNQRGCDAQAWGVTEALRVWKRLAQTPNSERTNLLLPSRNFNA